MPGSQMKRISCLLDTDIVIDFLRRRNYARQLLERWSEEGLLAISTLTHLEVCQGMKKGEEVATNSFLDGLVTVVVDIPIARKAGNIIGEFRLRGITLSIGDAIIAATALHLNAPLLTNNIEHYPIADLKVVRGLDT